MTARKKKSRKRAAPGLPSTAQHPHSPVPKSPLTRLFHGGPAGLRVGDRIVPRNQLATRGVQRDPRTDPADAGRVYVSTDPDIAEAFAVANPGRSSVYEVEVRPQAALELDPDFPTLHCFSAPAATIIAVHTPHAAMSVARRVQLLAPGTAWTDGTPVYDEDGYLQPQPDARAWGFTAADLRFLGPWRELNTAYRLYRPTQVLVYRDPTTGRRHEIHPGSPDHPVHRRD